MDIDTGTHQVLRQQTVSNPHLALKKGKGIRVAQFLLGFKPDVVLTNEDLAGKGPGYAFADAGIETLQTGAKTVNELVQQLLN